MNKPWICPEGTGRETCFNCPEEKKCSYAQAKVWLINQTKRDRSGYYDKDRKIWHW